jgi:hypothetical protein
MTALEKKLVNKGLPDGEEHFVGTPFTLFSVTRDYSCAPHDDDKDYEYRFIFWLYPSGRLRMDACPIFWLPEYKVSYSSRNRSTFFLNSSSIIHCTTKPFEIGVLGFAIAKRDPSLYSLKIGPLIDPAFKIGVGYLTAKTKYEVARV